MGYHTRVRDICHDTKFIFVDIGDLDTDLDTAILALILDFSFLIVMSYDVVLINVAAAFADLYLFSLNLCTENVACSKLCL
jgi:hypothetical protein